MTPQRPPQPVNALPGSECPTCGKNVPVSTHSGCPRLLAREEERARRERERARLFGIEVRRG